MEHITSADTDYTLEYQEMNLWDFSKAVTQYALQQWHNTKGTRKELKFLFSPYGSTDMSDFDKVVFQMYVMGQKVSQYKIYMEYNYTMINERHIDVLV
tara:strand:- start:2434 stop:2727 length:294 start_codon:yes stop_codon:yes gene_type:complete